MIDAYATSGTSPSARFEPLLDDKQAGEMLGLHPKTVQRLLRRRGDIPAVRFGRTAEDAGRSRPLVRWEGRRHIAGKYGVPRRWGKRSAGLRLLV